MRVKSAIILLLLFSGATHTFAEDDDGYTITRPARGVNWAILVGINYTSRQDQLRDSDDAASQNALPALTNAANDAIAVASILKQYYQYDDEHVIVLADEKGVAEPQLPTKQNIDRALQRVRKDATEDDTVLFFFAGHGLKFDSTSTGGNNVAILALDVELKDGEAKGNTYDLPFGLVDELGHIKANQKLVILDCCFSGEIFNQQRGGISFQATSDESSRRDESLQTMPTFQAMASCRATQLASDGNDGNSRFTSALLHGLRRLPAQTNKHNVTVHGLLSHTQSYLDASQRPDCRNLVNMSGEFCFRPRADADFSKFLVQELEEAYLRSMVVSRQGGWWFREMPWFIPSIRAEMVRVYDDKQVASRGNELADLLDKRQLQAAAKSVLANPKRNEGLIATMRRGHASLLLQADDGRKLKEAWEEIESDLEPLLPSKSAVIDRGTRSKVTAVNSSDKTLQAVDVHLLAVVKHALGKTDAEGVYERALEMYSREKKSSIMAEKESERLPEGAEGGVNYSLQILGALCRVDYAELLQGKLKQHKLATVQYQEARREIDQLHFKGKQRGYAAFFKTFNYCREADAWLAINRWGQANDRLTKAKSVASGNKDEDASPVKEHFLEAHVYRRDAWAKMIQWRIEEAICSFHKSNQILVGRFESAYKLLEPQLSGPPTLRRLAAPPSHDELDCVTSLTPHQRLAFETSSDYASKVAYLHNLHGVAMATRFRGETAEAAKAYRALVERVEATFTQFRDNSADADIEQQFIVRTINTQERLGDCNLFGDPQVRDVREAIDDYRRAMTRVHLTRDENRDRNTATLLYKQALALSLPTPAADHELATEMCARADELYKKQQESANGLFDALGTLTTLAVRASQTDIGTLTGTSSAQEALRKGILAYRDKVGTTPHRDQLEMLLFCSRVLVEHSGVRSKYQTLADADLLISFCQMALEPYRGASGGVMQEQSDSIKYLRPYFDAAMESKMKLGDSHVKELLQIQAEATQGVFDIKGERVQPVLAIYALNNKAYLLVDIPKGLSTCVPLAESYYTVGMVQKACTGEQLPLPDKVGSALSQWIAANSNKTSTAIPILRWTDPVRGFQGNVPSTKTVVDRTTGEPREVVQVSSRPARFPFELPGFDVDD